MLLSDQARAELGWSEDEAGQILRGLGFAAPAGAAGEAPGLAPARARAGAAAGARRSPAASPFAALAALKPAPRQRGGRHRAGPRAAGQRRG